MTATSLTPAQVAQLRRDAKRVHREQGISHARALDQLAVQHGYQNWSLLARNAATTHASSAPATAELRVPAQALVPNPYNPRLRRPRLDASRSEVATIMAIVKRFGELVGDDIQVDRLGLMMDIEACHCNGCPLDLISLHEAARDLDFVHDVAGIHRHLNRETGKLEDCFWPRYAAQAVELTN